MIISDSDLKNLIESNHLLIEPLTDDTVQQNGIDFRLGDELAINEAHSNVEVLESTSSESIRRFYRIIKSIDGHFVFLPLRHYLLTTKENLRVPHDLMGFCGLRSTFARLGFVSPLTIIDAGFEGTLTIGVLYGGNCQIRVPVGCRFLHVVFAHLIHKADSPYQGHYKNQKGVALPKVLT